MEQFITQPSVVMGKLVGLHVTATKKGEPEKAIENTKSTYNPRMRPGKE